MPSFPEKPKRFIDDRHIDTLSGILRQIQGGMSKLQELNKNMDTLDDDDFVAKMTTPSDDLTSQLDLALDFKDFLKSFGTNSPIFLKEVEQMLNELELTKRHVAYFNSVITNMTIDKESSSQEQQQNEQLQNEKPENHSQKKVRFYTQAVENMTHSVQKTVDSMFKVVKIISMASKPIWIPSLILTAEEPSTSSTISKRKNRRQKQRNRVLCILCRKHGHSTENCEKYASVHARVERISALNLCRTCLKHVACKEPCMTPPENLCCSSCKGKHFTILCPIVDIVLYNNKRRH